MAQIAVHVLVGEIAELGTFRYLPICELYIPVFERLRVHQFSAEIVSCQSPNNTFQSYGLIVKQEAIIIWQRLVAGNQIR